ncbi:PTS trehalose transporter subunit IIBC [Clostridium brassicae]|uniref:PTS trehalose transporter subunit IIBC n=1 Tax=Clostridium brassicae TaxID=2999072 RepID=A0ABT4DHG3_9CLOT|nr:PTS trehalose transporter subunit IIBC [Clostridium brassicae]MCY6960454.1 PTS trehalose transporter subunit IIBC [Clostridium brassicae]
MSKFTNEAKQLLEYIGGKDNISAVSHCVTRMRFVLNNPSKADVDKIEKIKCVKGTFTQAGQFQVIVGNEVTNFYNDFVNVSGVDGVSKDSAKEAAKKNMNVAQKALAHLAEIFSPLIPAIIVGGLILGFRNIIGDIKFLENGTKSIIQVYQFWAGVHSFLWLIGEAIFFFLPVGITWSISKKMGATQILGIVLGITLVSPQLLNAYAVATATNIPVWDFGFAQVKMIGYQAQVIPAILAGFVFASLELKLRKIVPEYISMIVVPFLSLIPTVLIAHVILGPLGWKIGSVISNVVYTGLTSSLNWLFAAIFGFAYAPLVITGLHHMTNAIDLQLMAQFWGTSLWPMIALSNIAQGSAVLAMLYMNKDDEEEKQVAIPAMIGSSIAAITSVGLKVMANSIGIGGLPGILSIKPQNMLSFAIAMIIAVVIPFILTIVFHKKGVLKK